MNPQLHHLRLAAALCVAALGLSGAASAASSDSRANSTNGVRYDGGDEIILQGFHWNSVRTNPGAWYDILRNQAATIAADGFTSVWMPVPWNDRSSWSSSDGTYGGGEGYFWSDFSKNSQYGSDSQLQQASAALHGAQLKVIYDVVPNHHNRGHSGDAIDLPGGQGYYRSDCANWNSGGGNDCDDGDAFMSGDSDFNTAHPTIYNLFRDEFANLKNNYGGDGLRFDFVRGYGASRVNSWMTDAGINGFCVGELWKAPGEYPSWDWRYSASWQDALKDWSDHSKCTVFDFALKERMQNGSLSDWRYGLNGNPDPRWREVAVTFVDNHDTGYSPGPNGGQHHWPLPDSQRKLGYAYILSSPGTPVVYWPHMYDWGLGDFIRQLIRIRKMVGVKAYSDIQFSNAFSGLIGTVTGTQGKLVFALNSNLADPSQISSGSFSLALNTDSGQIRIWTSTSSSSLVNVRFRCDNGITNPGDSVYVVGSSGELGSWDASQAILLGNSGTYPTWSGNLQLPANQALAWKCIIRQEASPYTVRRWQSGNNNQVVTGEGVTSAGQL